MSFEWSSLGEISKHSYIAVYDKTHYPIGENMKSTLIALAIVTMSASATAQSANQFYGEAIYDTISVKDTTTDDLGTSKPKAARLTLGTVVMDNLAVEGSFLFGMGSSTASNNSDVSIKIKNGYSIALRPFVNVTPELELFGRVGKAHSKTEWQAGADSGSDSQTDTIYGAGLAYKVSNGVRAVLDYTKSPEKDGSKVSRIGVGVRLDF